MLTKHGNQICKCEGNKNKSLKSAQKYSILFIEASAKASDCVQCAFEEFVEKIIQTPGLCESDNQNKGIKLSHREKSPGREAVVAVVLCYKLGVPSPVYLTR